MIFARDIELKKGWSMSEKVKEVILMTVMQILDSSMSAKNIRRMAQKHEGKVHFIPIRYRIIGGILQGLNIKFGNFIELLLKNIVEMDTGVKGIEDSGKKIRLFFTPKTDSLIDSYISSRQLPNSPDDCTVAFEGLLQKILENEDVASPEERQGIVKDVDGLFQTDDGAIVYTELKYN